MALTGVFGQQAWLNKREVGPEHDVFRFCSFVFNHQRFLSSTVKLFTHYMADPKDTEGTGTMTRCVFRVRRCICDSCGLCVRESHVRESWHVMTAGCMRDVKEVHTGAHPVCRQLASAFLCDKNPRVWTYESEVSSPSIRHISAYVTVG